MWRPDLEMEEMYVYRLPPIRGSGAAEETLRSIRSRCLSCGYLEGECLMDICI